MKLNLVGIGIVSIMIVASTKETVDESKGERRWSYIPFDVPLEAEKKHPVILVFCRKETVDESKGERRWSYIPFDVPLEVEKKHPVILVSVV